ncbi:MAG: ATP/GTP-binding protein [Candidatus Thorarchaeota archaeon]
MVICQSIPKVSKRRERWNLRDSYMLFTFLVGTAGSGKSLLTASLEKWLIGSGLSVTVVNLDPGVDSPPYTSDVDIREFVDYGEVISSFGLGPNGALVASLDMAVSQMAEMREEIVEMERDYVLVDCPGQMELFAYRNSGPLMVSGLKGDDVGASLYLLDSNIARTPSGYLSSMLLGVSISIRFGLPQLSILSKSDILMEEEIEEILQWVEEPDRLEQALNSSSHGMRREYAQLVLEMMQNLGSGSDVIPVSAKGMTGLDILYGELQRVFTGGDNLYE